MYYIERINLLTNGGISSVVEFGPGLNIIYGESNTGKSLILDCIDYMLGAEDHRFDAKLKLEKITLIINVDGKRITMSRELDSTDIEVSSLIEDIESGTYKAGNAKNSIKSVWLALMGIYEDVKILKTGEGVPQSLTVRTFMHTYIVDEERVHAYNSVLANDGNYGKVQVPVLASLLYLATGNNYLPDEKQTPSRIRTQRKDAVKKYVDRSMEALKDTKLSELPEFPKETPAELQTKIDQALGALGAEKAALSNATAKSRELADRIISIDEEIAEGRVLKNRNAALMTQYESDIMRLSFIAEGDAHGQELPRLDHCPFCNGELPKERTKSCIDAAIAEVEKIELKIKDLRSVQSEIDREQQRLEEERKRVSAERDDVDAMIRRDINPQIERLRDDFAKYTTALNQYKAQEMIEKFSKVLVSQLSITEEEESGGFSIKIKDKFREVFGDRLSEVLTDILKSSHYFNYINSRFDSDDCDVVVNGSKKKTQGQGYRAFLNTALAIAVQDCIDEYDKYRIGMLVIDSPIQSLKEKEDKIPVDERTTQTMKSGLFTYLLNHQGNRQTIIIENDIPDLDYSGTHIEEFTKDEKRGRYGLITDYRE